MIGVLTDIFRKGTTDYEALKGLSTMKCNIYSVPNSIERVYIVSPYADKNEEFMQAIQNLDVIKVTTKYGDIYCLKTEVNKVYIVPISLQLILEHAFDHIDKQLFIIKLDGISSFGINEDVFPYISVTVKESNMDGKVSARYVFGDMLCIIGCNYKT